jgi:hypothetical protein
MGITTQTETENWKTDKWSFFDKAFGKLQTKKLEPTDFENDDYKFDYRKKLFNDDDELEMEKECEKDYQKWRNGLSVDTKRRI